MAIGCITKLDDVEVRSMRSKLSRFRLSRFHWYTVSCNCNICPIHTADAASAVCIGL